MLLPVAEGSFPAIPVELELFPRIGNCGRGVTELRRGTTGGGTLRPSLESSFDMKAM
jgi:hypothetical protein